MAQSNEFQIGRNDTLPSISGTLLDENRQAPNLTGAEVRFHMMSDDGTPKVNAPSGILDAVNGRVRYNWQPGDTDEEGYFSAEWEVVFPDGKRMTFPNGTKVWVNVIKDLA